MENKKILVVDDDKGIRDAVSCVLEEEGYNVSSIGDAMLVSKTIQDFKPNLIILDLLLSGKDGSSIVQEVRSMTEFSKTPILMFSAYPLGEKIASEAGADGFISKPFDIMDLIDQVQKHL